MYNMVTMKDFVGNRATIDYLKQAMMTGNLSHAYLFCGPENVGKTRVGKYFAKLLLCEGNDPHTCHDCVSCKLFESNNHPDFFLIDKETVLVDEIRDLVSSLDLKPYRGKGKVVLISHAERLTNQALNSFLKALEEPDGQTTIILTTENKKNLLPTIVSRARLINFLPASNKQVFEYINGELGVKKQEANEITKISAGRVGLAVTLANDPDKTAEITALINQFNQVYKSQDIHEKVFYADKFSKDKDNLLINLQYLEVATREELIQFTPAKKKEITEIVEKLDKIEESREMILKNANAKLVIEGLLLRSLI